jgi:predicted AlkP superfamily phosphohydrolase/phosphomutase
MNRAWIVICICLVAAASNLAAAPRKVVVIGFDGADPNLVQQYMSQGLLPHLQQLSEEGKFAPLTPTNPPQTPVSWSTFATGLSPGRTQIFDFLQRDAKKYTPDFALATREKKPFFVGEMNGLVGALIVGSALSVLIVLVVGVIGKKFVPAVIGAVLVEAACLLLLKGPIGKLLPEQVPHAKNARHGTAFWKLAADAGLDVRVTHVPVTFPAEELPGDSSLIAGLGVPDMRGRVGTPTLWTSNQQFAVDGSNEFSLELMKLPAQRGRVETTIAGPYNYPFFVYVVDKAREQWKAEGLSAAERSAKEKELKERLKSEGIVERIDLKLNLEISDQALQWNIGDQSGSLKPGEWSDWVVFDFPVNWLVDKAQPLRGMSRFKLLSLSPHVELYLGPINFHPSCHPVRYSWPENWSQELSEKLGLFKTIGWSIDTWSYPSGVGEIDLFEQDMWHTVERQRKVLDEQLGVRGADLYVQVFDFPDRAGHMLWHQIDDQHPLFKPELAEKYRAIMQRVYQQVDEIVGRARELAGPDALFIVVSDHGFSSFRRQINYNTWLYQKGYFALKGKFQVGGTDLEQLFDKDVKGVNAVLGGIDWSRTKAWAMGLGAIYINVAGRDPQGIVMPGEEYEQLVREIQQGLENEVDPVTGLKPVHKVYRREEMYKQFDAARMPDLRAANIANYRVSWQDSLGGLSTDIFENNPKVWSGDHCSLDPSVVPGIFFVNRQVEVADPGIIDIAPSILHELGIKPDTTLDGRVIWQARGQ